MTSIAQNCFLSINTNSDSSFLKNTEVSGEMTDFQTRIESMQDNLRHLDLSSYK